MGFEENIPQNYFELGYFPNLLTPHWEWVTVRGFDSVFEDMKIDLSSLCMHMLYLSCFKITGRDDPAKRGVERPYTRATSKVTPAVPVVSISPSTEVWEEPWGIRRTSRRTLWTFAANLGEEKKKEDRFNLFDVFTVLIFLFASLAWEFCRPLNLHISWDPFVSSEWYWSNHTEHLSCDSNERAA